MNCEPEEYRFARIEAYRVTLARLGEQFRDRAVNLDEMEAAVAGELAKKTLNAPWRRSKTERAGCREGVQLAVREFLSRYREALGNLRFNRRG